ncbi:hypothetical protein CDD81_4160 [Ophiocordyceps australis]|uniref:Uncharacterized protein n=1 Tax=Ophiocordyceps australis TaxID=1399860 RepID=A0A2C5XW35_9HYPO|nr:hypothetical protein CDD81_4160 [Ophiocordyceps australis]
MVLRRPPRWRKRMGQLPRQLQSCCPSGGLERPDAWQQRRHLFDKAPRQPPRPPLQHQGGQEACQPLDSLLRAIHTKNAGQVASSFLAWTSLLQDDASPLHAAAVSQAQGLSAPALSDVLRSLDPLGSPQLDVAHGLCISQGQAQSSDLGSLLDEFGVRHHHGRVLAGMQCLLKLRNDESSCRLMPADYGVLLRCAGAALDLQAAKRFWADMALHGLQSRRTTSTWTDFIKARFVTEPVYYQFHLGRVALSARHLYANRSPLPMAVLKRLDKLRLSINASMREPWNRRRDDVSEDMMRLLRRRHGYRGYKGHWLRALFYGLAMDEALLCASIIAFARSGSLRMIDKAILAGYYGIHIARDGGTLQVSGGHALPRDSPIMPTARLLNAIVDGLGSLSHTALAGKLVDFISCRYALEVPAETWSKLLNWTYVCASKPLSQMRRVHGSLESTIPTPRDVSHLWSLMTSPRHSMEPSFADCNIAMRALIHLRAIRPAVDLLRNQAMPLYQRLVRGHDQALLEEALVNDHRNGPIVQVLVPDLVREFAHFLPPQVRYRSAQGHVQLLRPGATRRYAWDPAQRLSLPQKRAAIYVRHLEKSDEPDFDYPRVASMPILEWQRRPYRRLETLGRAPLAADSRLAWWKRLEKEMML